MLIKNININKLNIEGARRYYNYLLELYQSKNIRYDWSGTLIIKDENTEILEYEASQVISYFKSTDIKSLIDNVSTDKLLELRVFVVYYLVAPLIFSELIDVKYFEYKHLLINKTGIANLIELVKSNLNIK